MIKAVVRYIFTVFHIIGRSKVNERLHVMTSHRMLLDDSNQ